MQNFQVKTGAVRPKLPPYNPRHVPVVIVKNPLAELPAWLNQPVSKKAYERHLVLALAGPLLRRRTRPRIRIVAQSAPVRPAAAVTALPWQFPLVSNVKFEAMLAALNGQKEVVWQLVSGNRNQFTDEEIRELSADLRQWDMKEDARKRVDEENDARALAVLARKLAPVVPLPPKPSLRVRLRVITHKIAWLRTAA